MRVPVALQESIPIAIGALRANKARSALTTLGIIIGIVAVVLTMTAANGDTLVFALGGEHCPWGLYTVTGGTGRFEGATGGGMYRDTQTSSNPDFSGTDTSEFEGVLKLKEGSN